MNRELLKKHFEDMPLMQPIDALKLVFQHSFGCTHMSPYQKPARDALQRELDSVTPSPDVPVCTLIGAGLCRLNLASPRVNALGEDCISRMMQSTIFHVLKREHREFPGPGNELRYYGSLTDVETMIRQGHTSFSLESWRELLDWHQKKGRPAVSHSAEFRKAYDPHYRVVMEDCAALLPVIERMKTGQHQAVVIDGPCGSGKSTLGEILRVVLEGMLIPMDDFFLPLHMRTQDRLSQPGGNIHHERFKAEILDKFKVGEPLEYLRFDCQTGQLKEKAWPKRDMLVVEGSYSHHPVLRQAYSRLNPLRVYVDVTPEEQLRRLALRDPERLDMFRTRWIPLEKTYFEAYDIKDQADLVLMTQPWLEDEM